MVRHTISISHELYSSLRHLQPKCRPRPKPANTDAGLHPAYHTGENHFGFPVLVHQLSKPRQERLPQLSSSSLPHGLAHVKGPETIILVAQESVGSFGRGLQQHWERKSPRRDLQARMLAVTSFNRWFHYWRSKPISPGPRRCTWETGFSPNKLGAEQAVSSLW